MSRQAGPPSPRCGFAPRRARGALSDGRGRRAGDRSEPQRLLESRAMQALYVVIPVMCIFTIAYRYYSAFIAAKVMVLDDARLTPAHTKYDGANYHPMSRWVLFGHHFAAIAGAGPLVGPVLAAQFGFA